MVQALDVLGQPLSVGDRVVYAGSAGNGIRRLDKGRVVEVLDARMVRLEGEGPPRWAHNVAKVSGR